LQPGQMKKVLASLSTNKMDHQLKLFVGMEVIVTENLALALGIANGSHAYVVSVQLTEDAVKQQPRVDENGMRHYDIRDIGRVIVRLQ
jgi:uncharacterized protein YneF (UPF0154 family)